MPARAFKLYSGRVIGTGITVLYTCPAATVVIVKTLSERNAGGVTVDFAYGAYASGSTNPVNWINYLSPNGVPSNVSKTDTGMWALASGDKLWCWSPAAFTFDVWVSGTKLT